MSIFNTTLPDCTVAPESAASDAGVAGAGILLAFIITAFLALMLSAFIVVSELRTSSTKREHNIPRQILQGLSDQQTVEGLAIQAIGLASVYSMIPYHFFIIWLLSLLSTATNFASLLALVQEFKRDWVLRWLRQFAMFINMVLTIVFGVFVLETNIKSLSPTLPIACVWTEHAQTKRESNITLSVVGTIAVIAVSCIVFALGTWYLHMRKQRWSGVVRCISLLVLLVVAIGATVRIILISQAFGTPSVPLEDEGEKAWSFGQLLTMFLLVLPFVSALEIFRGQLKVPHTNVDGDADQIPLSGGVTGELKPGTRYTYQPNPFFR